MIKQIIDFLKDIFRKINDNRIKCGLYSIYAIISVVFFLYYLFPSDDIKSHITQSVRQVNPNVNLKIQDVGLSFPLGVSLKNVIFEFESTPGFAFDKVKVSPSILSIIGFGRSYSFKFRAVSKNKGIIKGDAVIVKNSHPADFMINTVISEIELKNIDYMKTLIPRGVSGLASGSMTMSGSAESGIIMDSEVNILNCVTMFSFLGLNEIDLNFKQVDAVLHLSDNKLEIKDISVSGDQLNGSFKGNIRINEMPGKSILNITGTIKPKTAFLSQLNKALSGNVLGRFGLASKGIPVRFKGTVDKPTFSLQ